MARTINHPLFEKEIGEVVLKSGNAVSTGALASLGFWDIDVMVMTQRGRPVAMLKSLDDDSHVKTRLCQYEAYNSPKGILIAKHLVISKLEGQNQVLRKYGLRTHGFRFKDWADYVCNTSESLMIETEPSSGQYQMYKVYEAAIGFSEIRKISKPVTGTVQVFRTRDSVTTDITGASSINYTTGVVTITGHVSGDVYTWSGEFDVPCRFDTDRMPISIPEFGAYSWGQIPIKELLL